MDDKQMVSIDAENLPIFPLEIREIIHEYRGGFRIRGGKVSILATSHIEEKIGCASFTPGIWLSQYSNDILNFGFTTRMLLLCHSEMENESKVPSIDDIRNEPLLYNNVRTITLQDFSGDSKHNQSMVDITHDIPNSRFSIAPPRAQSGIGMIVIPMMKTVHERHAADLVRDYYKDTVIIPIVNKLQTLLPEQQVKMEDNVLYITKLSSRSWEKALPRLKKYNFATSLTVKQNPKGGHIIRLERKNKSSFTLKMEDLQEGKAWDAMKDIISIMGNVDKHIEADAGYMAIYRAITALEWCYSIQRICKHKEAIYALEDDRTYRIL